MKRKIIFSAIIIIAICLFQAIFTNEVNAETVKGSENLELENQTNPSEEFKLEEDNTDENLKPVGDGVTYTSGYYQYQIKENYRITATDVNYTLISDQTVDVAIITKYTGNESTVTIPTTLGGKRVYQIGSGAFNKNTSIKKLIIPDNSVGYIGEGAFADCTNLAEVSLGNSVENISYYAFQNTALTSIELPEKLEFITATTFFHCEKLTNITIKNKGLHYKVIDNVIFQYYASGEMTMILYPYAKKDTTYTVPNKVTRIYTEAIINNYLQTITISADVTDIWVTSYAFTTPNLRTINVVSSNTAYSSNNGVLFSKDKKTLYLYPAGKKDTTYNIPSGTTKIVSDAFFNTSNLQHINIPNTVTYIDTEGFGYAKGLVDITIPSSVTEFGAQLFRECPNLKKATISANAEVLSYLTFRECENLEEVIVNGNIKKIIKGAFYYCTKLTKVTLPDSLEQIEFGAFWCCRALKNITIPKNVVLLEDCAFYEYENSSKDYWADTNFDISQTQLKKQSNGNYMAIYDYTVKGTRDYDKAYEVLKLVNQERKKSGLKELTMDKDLLETAMKRSAEIVTYFSHDRPNGLSCYSAITTSYSMAAENIAMYQTTASYVMDSWMNSEGHRENIMNSRYTCIGIGCYKADDGNYYWTQVFTKGTPTTVTKPQNKNTTETIQISMNKVPFNDVKSTQWYFNAVKYSVSNRIILGYNSSTFAPNDKLTRAMMVTILYRMEGSPSVSGNSKFSDVESGEWYSKAIKWATDKGIVHGYSGTNKFGPNDNIIRQDLAGILRNYANYKKKNTKVTASLTKFKDYNKVDSYANSAIQWAVGTGVITGNDDGTLNPHGSATRAEAAAMIQKYCNKIGR